MDRAIQGKILLVGEGDFSFTVALLTKLSKIGESEVVATSLETSDSINKHRNAAENMEILKGKGVKLILDVDATKLHDRLDFKEDRFSRIIFNFPHVGGKSNHRKNRKLLNDFFHSAVQVLDSEGQIFVTLCKGQGGTPADRPMRAWHDSWQVVSMAANSGLILVAADPFQVEDFEAYTSTGFRSIDKGFHTENAITHVFEKAEPVAVPFSAAKLPVTVGNDIYMCTPYIYHKMKILREIESDSNHPFNLTIQYFTKMFLEEESQGHTVSQIKLNVSSHATGSETELGSSHSQNVPKDSSLNKAGTEAISNYLCCIDGTAAPYSLMKGDNCNGEPCFTIPHTLFKKRDNSDSILYLRTSLMDEFTFRNVLSENQSFVECGPVFRGCHIKPGCFPIQYHLLLVYKTTLYNVDQSSKHFSSALSSGQHYTNKNMCPSNITYRIETETNTHKNASILKISDTDKCNNSEVIMGDMVQCPLESSSTCSISKSYILEKTIKHLKCFLGEQCQIKFSETDVANSKSTVIRSEFDCTVLGEILATSLDSEWLSCAPIGDLLELKTVINQKPVKQLAVCLYLDEIIALKMGIKDKRLLYSVEKHVTQQFAKLDFAKGHCSVKCTSLYPMTFVHDMSFWENENIHFDEMKFCDVIRDIAGDVVINVELIDRYKDPASERYSRCYRMTFHSPDKVLSYDTSWKLQSLIRLEVEKQLKIILR